MKTQNKRDPTKPCTCCGAKPLRCEFSCKSLKWETCGKTSVTFIYGSGHRSGRCADHAPKSRKL